MSYIKTVLEIYGITGKELGKTAYDMQVKANKSLNKKETKKLSSQVGDIDRHMAAVSDVANFLDYDPTVKTDYNNARKNTRGLLSK